MTALEKMIEESGIRAIVVSRGIFKSTDPKDDWRHGSNAYRVTLRRGRRSYAVDFFTGSGWTREPTAADVLSSLLSDATSYDSARGFADWCADLGFDTDSRKAERTYRACGKVSARLHRFLGDLFETFAQAEH